MLGEGPQGADRPSLEVAAAVGTEPSLELLDARIAPGALEAADVDAVRIGREFASAALAVRSQLKHQLNLECMGRRAALDLRRSHGGKDVEGCLGNQHREVA